MEAGMKAWRMAFKNGSRGYCLWPQCLENGVAVIAYAEMGFDLSKYRPEKFPRRWAALSPEPKYSLKAFAYSVKTRHVIYAKDGSWIVGRGTVNRGYYYDPSCPVMDENRERWPHVLGVRWEPDFMPVEVFVGDNQRYTVRPLTDLDLARLRRSGLVAARRNAREQARQEAIEGKALRREIKFRQRNRALIQAKKSRSDYHCEICGFSFEEKYGTVGKEFIIAHHVEPLGSRRGASPTTLEEIKLICGNCHAIIHRVNPALAPDKLRARINKN
jgi:HNH endonuclease